MLLKKWLIGRCPNYDLHDWPVTLNASRYISGVDLLKLIDSIP